MKPDTLPDRTGTNMHVRAKDLSWNFLIPFCIVHVACLGIFWTGFSWPTVIAAIVLYGARTVSYTHLTLPTTPYV